MPDNHKVFAITSLCTGCRTCEIVCAVTHSDSKTLISALFESPSPRYRIEVQYGSEVVMPLNCRHCDEPDCLFACKAGAVNKDSESGQVRVDLDKCVGCWMCVMVCPFGAVKPDMERCKATKCDLCEGRSEGPACVAACPTGALIFGTIEDAERYLDEKKRPGAFRQSA